MLRHEPSRKDQEFLWSRATLRFYYPGDVVMDPGVYRVQHSMNHHTDCETYIDAGLFLPHCNLLGCHVHYELIKRMANKC